MVQRACLELSFGLPMYYSSGLMIIINYFDVLLRVFGDRFFVDEDSRGGGFAIFIEVFVLVFSVRGCKLVRDNVFCTWLFLVLVCCSERVS